MARRETIIMNFEGREKDTLARLDRAVAEMMDGFTKVAKSLDYNSPGYQNAMHYAGAMLRDAIRANAPDSDRVHYRYAKGKGMPRGTGRLVAEYHPGNLRRSIKILTHMTDKRNVYVGVEIQPVGKGRGVFTGDRTDGWYAYFLEYNPGSRPFMRPAILANQDKIYRKLLAFIDRKLKEA